MNASPGGEVIVTLNEHLKPGKVVPTASFILAAGGLAFLSVIAYGTAYTDADLQIAQWIQSLNAPGLDTASDIFNILTSAPVTIAMWAVSVTFFMLRGRPLEAIAVMLVSGLWAANYILGIIVDRPASALVETGGGELLSVARGSFPSGHVTAAVVYYSVMSFLILSNLRGSHLRLKIIIPAFTITVIGLASFARVYDGAHWPSDILGSYLMGLIGVIGIVSVYSAIKEDRFSLPSFLRKKKERPQEVDGITLTGSIASRVILDSKAGTATKEYRPPWLIRAMYWLSFQASFPYQGRSEALEAAAVKRKIAGLLTRHRFGYEMVAAVRDIESDGSRFKFVTELVEGSEPKSNKEIEEFLSEIYTYFLEIGFPTWQISSANPHAYSNFIRNSEGELRLIDLESAIVSFSLPFREFLAALREGHYPAFDDVDFARLRRYLSDNSEELRHSFTPQEFADLYEAVEVADARSHDWRHSEPRIWGHISQRIYRTFDMSRLITKVKSGLNGTVAMAQNFMVPAIDRWESEGRITSDKANELRATLKTQEVAQLLKHLGTHFVITVALRFPLGSIVRFGWTLWFRIMAQRDLSAGKITKEQYAEAKSLHSIPVMIIGFIPMLGAIAYFASGPMRKAGLARLMLDQFAYKLPFKVYHRMRLSAITAPGKRKVSARGPDLQERLAAATLNGCDQVSTALGIKKHAHAHAHAHHHHSAAK